MIEHEEQQHSEMHGVADHLRARALEDFGFFANSVLGASLPDDLCTMVNECVRQRQDVVLTNKRAQTVRSALALWLYELGYDVVGFTSDEVHSHETHTWLFGGRGPAPFAEYAVSVRVSETGVLVEWSLEEAA